MSTRYVGFWHKTRPGLIVHVQPVVRSKADVTRLRDVSDVPGDFGGGTKDRSPPG